MFLIKHTHGSGLYKTSPELLERDLDAWAKDSNLITVTEVTARARANMLKERGWAHYRGEKNKMAMNVAAMWRRDDWTVLYTETVQVSKDHYWTKKGAKRDPMAVIFVVLQNPETKKRLCLCVGHLPSSVEGRRSAPGKSKTPRIFSTVSRRVAVHIQATHGIRKAQKRISRRFRCHARLIVADWNLDLKRAQIRGYFKSQFPGMKVTWTKPYPPTHGRRLIDFALVGPRKKVRIVRTASLRKKTKASDHTAFRHVLAFKGC